MLLITGANGQLGTCLKDLLGEQKAYFLDAAELDITDGSAVNAFGRLHAVSGIINCAAFNDVDGAQSQPELVRKINETGPLNLAYLATARNVPLVHISTDYVFDGNGNTPLTETDATGPLGVYGQSKLAGEKAVLENAQTAVIIRTAWLYSPYGKNFVKTMLKKAEQGHDLRVVADQFGTPTYAPNLARVILQVLSQIKPGSKEVYHFTDDGVASWYDLAAYALYRAGKSCQVSPISRAAYTSAAQRPVFTVLNKAKIKREFKLSGMHWTQGVDECLKKLS